MKPRLKIFTLFGIGMVILFSAMPVLAFPPLPSSFYGTVKINQANVPDGTLVKASINGQIYAQTQSQTYQGESVFALDIPGDDSSTTTIEGGRDGDTITFIIGTIAAGQTGTWKSGTSIHLDLSESATVLQDTLTPTMTSTEVPIVVQALPTLPDQSKSTQSADVTVQVLHAPAMVLQPTPTKPSQLIHPSPASTIETGKKTGSSASSKILLIIGIILISVILFITICLVSLRKPSMK
jgi:hypothetical protein